MAIPNDVSLDPAVIGTDLEYSIGQNLFDGLYRLDDHLQEKPDLAAAMPDVSSDGLVYTIQLRPDAKFWDGHSLTAQDVIYSWNRVADDPDAPYASIFQPVEGYQEVQDSLGNGQPPPLLRGLTAPDPHTIVIRLTSPAGYFVSTLALPATWVLNQAEIEANGRGWSNDPNGAVGTGPFRLTSRSLGRFMTLVPVERWWGGSTGWLKRVEIDVVPDLNTEARGYVSGRFDLIGLGDYGPHAAGTTVGQMLVTDPKHAREVRTYPYARTDWIGFNTRSGPFAGPNGSSGRRALSLAVDRKKLARAVCVGGIVCVPATGGLISPGMAGYLGNGSDPTSAFDPAVAKADLQAWDPDGTKRQHLTYVYVANPLFREVADNLREQWKANLGITVQLQGYDTHTYLYERLLGDYNLFRSGWAADYDSPQDWYDVFLSDPNVTGPGYLGPAFTALVARADASSGELADIAYGQAGRMLLDEAVVAPLFYYTRTVVAKPYVDGFGASAFFAYPLTEVKILQH